MEALLTYLVAALVSLFLAWQLIKLLFPWLPKDLAELRVLSPFAKRVEYLVGNRITVAERLHQVSKVTPEKPCLLFEDEVWTFKQMNEWTNRATRALDQLGVKQGDQIALMMYNHPAYVAILMASMRIGSEIALINYNLKSKVLLHSLTTSGAKLLIIGGDENIAEAVNEIRDEINMKVLKYTCKEDEDKSLKHIMDEQSSDDLEERLKPKFSFKNTSAYIYTSGTTGKPKAVKMSFAKFAAGSAVPMLYDYTEDDVMYCALPFYHTAGCMCCLMASINFGTTLAVRRHFSASNFLKDCRKYDVTAVQYIGETLRYVCLQPPTPEDRNNKIRLVFGNGLRPDVWATFLDRFGPDISVHEFYAATEGNIFFMNRRDGVGTIGTCSPLMKIIKKVAFVKYDLETDTAYRDENGRCVEVSLNEPGLVLGKVTPKNPFSNYKGNKELTNQKILRDVFKVGDCYFNSGDLMMRDSHYGVHFCDRVGDTFRWRGENVSTNEVADVLATFPGVEVANVYGVQIKGQEGRAGMAALVLDEDNSRIDLKALYEHCRETLPKYAVPIFIRVLKSLDHTGTMKLQKVRLKREGFDLTLIKNDKLYFLDNLTKSYVPLTEDKVKEVEQGKMKL